MARRLGVIMDPIAGINPKKDTTLALLLAAQRRGFELEYMEMGDLCLLDGEARARRRRLQVHDSLEHWYDFESEYSAASTPLAELDCILMRKDPPFDMEFVFSTYLLERAQQAGTLVLNDPRAIRDSSEKLYTAWFADLCPPTLVTRRQSELREYLERFGDIDTGVKRNDENGVCGLDLVLRQFLECEPHPREAVFPLQHKNRCCLRMRAH